MPDIRPYRTAKVTEAQSTKDGAALHELMAELRASRKHATLRLYWGGGDLVEVKASYGDGRSFNHTIVAHEAGSTIEAVAQRCLGYLRESP